MRPNVALAERRAALLHAAAMVSKEITTILAPDRLLQRIVDVICDEFGFYYAGVFLVDVSGQWAVLRAGRGQAGATMVAEGHKLRVDGHSMIARSPVSSLRIFIKKSPVPVPSPSLQYSTLI